MEAEAEEDLKEAISLSKETARQEVEALMQNKQGLSQSFLRFQRPKPEKKKPKKKKARPTQMDIEEQNQPKKDDNAMEVEEEYPLHDLSKALEVSMIQLKK